MGAWRICLSTWSLTAITVFSFCCGALAVWLAFGFELSAKRLGEIGVGSYADWLAALGTWAAAYGAVAISRWAKRQELIEKKRTAAEVAAREAHAQAEDEERQREAARFAIAAQIEVVRSFMMRFSPIISAARLAEGVLDDEAPSAEVQALIITGALEQMELIAWTDLDANALGRALIPKFHELELCIRWFKLACKFRLGSLAHPHVAEEIAGHVDLKAEIDQLTAAMDGFTEAALDRIKELAGIGEQQS